MAGAKAEAAVAGRHWRLLGVFGAVFAVVGLADLGLTLYPARFGTPEWEFATVTAMLNGLPVMTMGVGLLAVAAVAGRRRRWLRALAVLCVLLAAGLVALAALYALTVPLALGSVDQPLLLLGIRKAIAKTVVQLVVYPVGFVTAGILCWRAARTS